MQANYLDIVCVHSVHLLYSENDDLKMTEYHVQARNQDFSRGVQRGVRAKIFFGFFFKATLGLFLRWYTHNKIIIWFGKGINSCLSYIIGN